MEWLTLQRFNSSPACFNVWQFFLLVNILVAVKDNHPKQFLFRHWRTCFELLDEDGSKSVSRKEFETLGFLFNFSRNAVKKIYDVFDVSGNSVGPSLTISYLRFIGIRL